MSKDQSVYDMQEALFDPSLIEMDCDEIPVTIMSGNIHSLDVSLIAMHINDKIITIDVVDPNSKGYYMDNPYAVIWKMLNDLRYSKDFQDVCINAGFQVRYEYE